jgi:predicted RNase H-like HicB family nuclease
MTPRYHINVFWSEEDRCWIADVPALKTCAAHGDTPEEAVAEVLVAMQAWLDVAQEHGQPAPEPRYKPAAHAAA